ncbi:O-acetyl-ADP-ribose deacetylase [Anaerotruncus sp. 2789STDY5834896]|uniref:Protein-ADP-ribose hydrolase n=1 Tax=uncultured Anaerotruncus sp. TaxID=905011 RepID=A0A1C6IXU2_9FIRM|nr:O-acetyl-ADP-ribose deacetylase [uncultured Anaerotruncus sp.]
MTQQQRLQDLIQYLLAERPDGSTLAVPQDLHGQKQLFRALLNLRPPQPVSPEFLQLQNDYLQAELALRGTVSLADIPAAEPGIYLWRGDITRLAVDGIVNAANSALLGCFAPCHGCIDNAIHSAAGVQLRQACAEIMRRQGHQEPTGQAKITPAFNLPCRYVLHTVGPIVCGRLTAQDRRQLVSCYRACLQLAVQNGLTSLAFCCISTGEFCFPAPVAAQIAVDTVRQFQKQSANKLEVIFDVFTPSDYRLYSQLLANRAAGSWHP